MTNMLDRLANLSPEKREVVLRRLQEKSKLASGPEIEQELVFGDMPLLPLPQMFLTMTTAFGINYHHFNVATLLKVEQTLDSSLVEEVVRYLLKHHDALRLRINQDENGEWQQYIVAPDGTLPVSTIDLTAVPETELVAAIEASAAQLQGSLHLANGPIVRFALFKVRAPQSDRLMVIIHHLAADEFSMRILLEDFETAYQQLQHGQTIHLSPKTTSYKERNEQVIAYAHSAEIRKELPYWLSLPWEDVIPLPVDYPEGLWEPAQPEFVDIQLSIEETQALTSSIPGPTGARIREVLVTALLDVFARWSGSRTQLLALSSSGRKPTFADMDLSRTIGWLAITPNSLLQLPETENAEELLRSVTEQLQHIPNEGLGYGLLSMLSGDEEIMRTFNSHPKPLVALNYLGHRFTPGQFHPAPESMGQVSQMSNLWMSSMQVISAELVDQQLQLRWEYSANVYQHTTIEGFIKQFRATLSLLSQR